MTEPFVGDLGVGGVGTAGLGVAKRTASSKPRDGTLSQNGYGNHCFGVWSDICLGWAKPCQAISRWYRPCYYGSWGLGVMCYLLFLKAVS